MWCAVQGQAAAFQAPSDYGHCQDAYARVRSLGSHVTTAAAFDQLNLTTRRLGEQATQDAGGNLRLFVVEKTVQF